MFKPVLIFLLLFMSSVFAQKQTQRRRGPPEGFTGGIAAIYVSSLYKGQEYRFRPIPSFSINYGRFSMFGPRLAYRVIGTQGGSVSIVAQPDFFGGYDADDSPAFTGMDERKGTANVGLAFNNRLGPININGNFTKDILGVHGGTSASLGVGVGMPINIFIKPLPFTFIGATFGARYYSESFINYYYGVKESEVAVNRVAYKSTSTTNRFFNLTMRMRLSEKWMLMFTYNREYLHSNIKNSPIVDKESIYRLFSNLSYSF